MVVLFVRVDIILLFLFKLFNFGMQIILLFEKLRFILKTLVQELTEAIQIMDAIDEEHEDLHLLW